MHRLTPTRFAFGLLALALAPQLAPAQQDVRFETADKVKLRGTLYPGGGNKSPCAILLHKLGGSRDHEGWAALATELQRRGFTVLTFDFRGHGDSTAVDPDVFYTLPLNKRIFQHGKEVKDRITYKDFVGHKKNYTYIPMLVNDIEAARNFLDQKNNAGECNSSSLVLVAAEEGAALGALWLTCQFKKAHYVPNPLGVGAIPDPRRTEGEDVGAAAWLSIPSYLTKQYPVATWLASPVRDKVPMLFVYGDKDEPAAKAAKYLSSATKTSSRTTEASKVDVKKGSKAAGADLLKGAQGAAGDIGDFVAKAMEKRTTANWEKRVTPPALTLLPLEMIGINLR